MKLKQICLASILVFGISGQAFASMAGLCNDYKQTQYICCPAKGGWIVSPDCNSGASPACVNNSGVIAGTGTSILEDCRNRGGSSVMYPFS